MNKKKFLHADNINKSYIHHKKYYPILNQISLDINFGETIAIVGSSGIGKSTFLQILGTLEKPDSGKIFYNGKNILELDETALSIFRNKEIGFVFQFHHLLSDFSVLENTMMPALIGKNSMTDAKKKAEKILFRVGMQERMKHRPHQLSGGERQKVAIARALVQHPRILLADEPTGNLDKQNSEEICNLLIQLNKEIRMTLVLVTHNNEFASRMSKQITISNGKFSEIN